MRFLCVQGLFAGACVPVSACPSPKATFQCVPKSARAFRPPVFVRPVLILAIYESKYTLHSYQAQNKAYLFLRGDPYRQTQRSKGPRCCKRRESKLSSLKLAMATDLARSPRWRPLSPYLFLRAKTLIGQRLARRHSGLSVPVSASTVAEMGTRSHSLSRRNRFARLSQRLPSYFAETGTRLCAWPAETGTRPTAHAGSACLSTAKAMRTHFCAARRRNRYANGLEAVW